MKLGFTGTSKADLTFRQRHGLRMLLLELRPREFHHGDCIKADEQAHAIVREECPDCVIHVHPPINKTKRAFCKGDVIYEPKLYLVRNAHIVSAATILAAAPEHMHEELRSGTWSTIRRARKYGKEVRMLWPQGGNDVE